MYERSVGLVTGYPPTPPSASLNAKAKVSFHPFRLGILHKYSPECHRHLKIKCETAEVLDRSQKILSNCVDILKATLTKETLQMSKLDDEGVEYSLPRNE